MKFLVTLAANTSLQILRKSVLWVVWCSNTFTCIYCSDFVVLCYQERKIFITDFNYVKRMSEFVFFGQKLKTGSNNYALLCLQKCNGLSYRLRMSQKLNFARIFNPTTIKLKVPDSHCRDILDEVGVQASKRSKLFLT